MTAFNLFFWAMAIIAIGLGLAARKSPPPSQYYIGKTPTGNLVIKRRET